MFWGTLDRIVNFSCCIAVRSYGRDMLNWLKVPKSSRVGYDGGHFYRGFPSWLQTAQFR